MTKVLNGVHSSDVRNGGSCQGVFLDTLAQLDHFTPNPLKKRALSKHLTMSFLGQLIDLKTDREKAYWNTYHCTSTLLQRSSGEVSATFCKNRWCVVCNRIRTAKLIRQYKAPMDEMKSQVFVTLTTDKTNDCITESQLSDTITDYCKTFANIWRRLKRKYGTTIGIRKTEITYIASDQMLNIKEHYHPHFHIVMPNDKGQAEFLVAAWLKAYPKANRHAQNIRPTNANTGVELFKYFAKFFDKAEAGGGVVMPYPANRMDTIFAVMQGRRIVQTYGGRLTQPVDTFEDAEGVVLLNESRDEIWAWEREARTWVSGSGELRT